MEVKEKKKQIKKNKKHNKKKKNQIKKKVFFDQNSRERLNKANNNAKIIRVKRLTPNKQTNEKCRRNEVLLRIHNNISDDFG